MPYGDYYCQLQLLFVFLIFTDLILSARKLFQWTLSLVSSVGPVVMQRNSHSILVFGFLFHYDYILIKAIKNCRGMVISDDLPNLSSPAWYASK